MKIKRSWNPQEKYNTEISTLASSLKYGCSDTQLVARSWKLLPALSEHMS